MPNLVIAAPADTATSSNNHITLALVGAPNCGKTALFNVLTGSKAKVANYSGVTVDKRSATFIHDDTVKILDLPGTYSLATTSPDEEVTRKVLMGEMPNEAVPDGIIVVADATNLRMSLRMILELKSLGLPMMVALNLNDVAVSRGMDVDEVALSKEIGLPVVKTVAIKRNGNKQLLSLITEFSATHKGQTRPVRFSQTAPDSQQLYQQADDIISRTVSIPHSLPKWHERLDYWALHPVVGVILLFLILFVIFQAVYAWATPMMDGLEALVTTIGGVIADWLPEGILKSLIVDGIIAGVGSVIVFVPQIALLFLFLLILEDSGYLPRAAFLLDNLLSKVGLSGRSFIPLLSGFACAVPAIMSTRTIPNPRERMVAISVLPMLTCSARLPIYALIIAAVVPRRSVMGVFNLQGMTLFFLYIAGITSAALISWIMTRFRQGSLQQVSFPLLMELPTYRMPNIKHIVTELWSKVRAFLVQAGTVIFALTVVLWFLVSFPAPPVNATGPAIDYSFAGMLGSVIEPIFRPIGFTWQMCIALIPGLAAREVVVAALGTVYAVGGASEEMANQTLIPIIHAEWGLATAFAFLVFYIYAPMCLATLAVIRRETKSMKQTVSIAAYLFVLAYVMAWITYRVSGSIFGFDV
ncbi:ferrous iron transporter B [Psychrobacter phenylpyruvicus]|uniref:Ferrous iron transport protein B n=1 Tax=Psychrobacter phenylpyruvicus TaxID=29432 RepID=A0A379LNJ4_9GAMM|nr:ferrous iron transporter B [Psychrobacter phenylpyruvicus]SUD91334.1 Ferrous iron transport protein B [Psychrobacter phenylpyruvicus]